MPDHRLWRLRKLHQSVDAELHHVSETLIEVRFLYNGELAYVRSYGTREGALGEAAAKRAELERDGWVFHW